MMTRNQIAYWELRWKQHYQKVELDLTYLKHQLDVEKVAQDWAKIKETQRAAIVAEALKLKEIELQAEKQASEIALNNARAQEILVKKVTAMNDMYLSIMEAERNTNRAYFDQLVTYWKEAFSVGAKFKVPGIGEIDIKTNPGLVLSEIFQDFLGKQQTTTENQRKYLNYIQDRLKMIYPNEQGWESILNTNKPVTNNVKNLSHPEVYEDLGQSTQRISNTIDGPGKQISNSERKSSVIYAGPRESNPVKRDSSPGVSGTAIVANNIGPGKDTSTKQNSSISGTKVIYSPSTNRSGPGM